jgi:hypothetical protein
MCDHDRRRFLARTAIGAGAMLSVALLGAAFAQTAQSHKKWTCPPCGCGLDGKELDAGGPCPECGMPLVEKTAARPSPSDGHEHPPATAAQKTPTGAPQPATPSTPPAITSPPSQ